MKTTTKLIAILSISVLATLSSSCVRMENSLKRYWQRETQTMGKADYDSALLFDSNNSRDFINADGSGTAIPAKAGYDLYLSPFAPTKGYVQSKLPAGSKVRCPYTNKTLYLGSRYEIAEKELP